MSKITLFLVLIFSQALMATESCPNYSGEWIGSCKLKEKTYESETLIKQDSCTEIEINGQNYYIGKPTIEVKNSTDKDGNQYKEVNSYNLRWSEESTQLLISIRWLGWNLNQPKTWSGAGAGSIKKSKKKLRSIRNFKSGKEICLYEKI